MGTGHSVLRNRGESSVGYPVHPMAAIWNMRAFRLREQKVLTVWRPFNRPPCRSTRVNLHELVSHNIEKFGLTLSRNEGYPPAIGGPKPKSARGDRSHKTRLDLQEIYRPIRREQKLLTVRRPVQRRRLEDQVGVEVYVDELPSILTVEAGTAKAQTHKSERAMTVPRLSMRRTWPPILLPVLALAPGAPPLSRTGSGGADELSTVTIRLCAMA